MASKAASGNKTARLTEPKPDPGVAAVPPAPSVRTPLRKVTPEAMQAGKRLLRSEASAVAKLAESLGTPFERAIELIVACADAGGTVLVTGLGKSGLVGAKISATLASLGIPSHAVHPSEAAHGDLGRFRACDTVICISFSGETDEVVNLASILRQDGLPIISITGQGAEQREGKASSLERLATVALTLGIEHEAGEPDFAAPTSSTTATLALGDALAVVSAKVRNFTDEDFKRRHPGGTLGDLLRPVTEVLRFVAGKNMPRIADDRTVASALEEAARAGRRPGAIVLSDPKTGRLTGLFTDGDLRRLILRDTADLQKPIREVMTRDPRCLPETALVRDAVRMVREFRADEIPVVNGAGEPVGLLDVQDLVAMRLVQD
ncbi:MAG: KpsF/GutQ family sugar-phosphate isomerase [Planctomycetes bacterium]|nr:KpsF/GutQ family sugar-phosphate isomerase [Planctomycetota bacterium]